MTGPASSVAFPGPDSGGLVDRGLDEPGVFRRRALPAQDPVGERVDHERGVGEHATGQPDVGEVGDEQTGRRWCPEPALDQVRCSIGSWVGDGGADPLEASHPLPAVGAHQPFHGARGHDDAVPVQMGPHLHRPIQRLGPLAALRVGLVVAGQDLGDHHVPQSSRRQRSFDPGIERSRGDPAAVLRQHATDRSDPEPSPVLGDERTDQRCRGSTLRTR
jgi:hypothetical protein